MSSGIDPTSVENLNRALRLYRRLLLRILIIGGGGFVIALLLARLGTALSPPNGVILFGEGLGTWGLIATLALLIAEIWIDGRGIGKALNDPLLKTMPAVGLLSGLSVIAQRAHAMDMEWTGFLGPLRPAQRRGGGAR